MELTLSQIAVYPVKSFAANYSGSLSNAPARRRLCSAVIWPRRPSR